MAGSVGMYVYNSDNGNPYNIRLDDSNAVATGATAAAAGAVSNKPGRMRPRYVLCRHPSSGRQRKLVICDPDNAMWLGGDGTVSLVDTSVHPSADIVHDIQGRIGEQRLA